MGQCLLAIAAENKGAFAVCSANHLPACYSKLQGGCKSVPRRYPRLDVLERQPRAVEAVDLEQHVALSDALADVSRATRHTLFDADFAA